MDHARNIFTQQSTDPGIPLPERSVGDEEEGIEKKTGKCYRVKRWMVHGVFTSAFPGEFTRKASFLSCSSAKAFVQNTIVVFLVLYVDGNGVMQSFLSHINSNTYTDRNTGESIIQFQFPLYKYDRVGVRV